MAAQPSTTPTPPASTDHDPLVDLVHQALSRRAALAILADRSVAVELPTATGDDVLLGLRCPRATVAVAYECEVVVHDRSGRRDSRVGVGVARHHDPVVIEAASGRRLAPETSAGVLVDRGRRALGLPTPAPAFGVAEVLDRLWLHRVLHAVLAADLGDPPDWRAISALHPLADGPASPGTLRRRRLGVTTTWDQLRIVATRSDGHDGPMTPSLARWHDAGSFARWHLADLPDPDVIVAELGELLRAVDAARLRSALGAPTPSPPRSVAVSRRARP